jgi:hypothetical protein
LAIARVRVRNGVGLSFGLGLGLVRIQPEYLLTALGRPALVLLGRG